MPAVTNDFDLDNVLRAFRAGRIPERAELIRIITDAMRDSAVVKMLVADIGMNAMNAKAQPVQVIGLGLMYGIVLGILLERDAAARRKKVN